MVSVFQKRSRPASLFRSFLFAKIEGRTFIALCGIAFSCILLFFVVYRPDFLDVLDKKLYDVMHRTLGVYGEPLPLIVDIDEKSLAEFGQWPWPRYRVAHLLEKLAAAGPSAVGVDIIFAEPDRTSLKEVQRGLRTELGLELSLAGIPDMLHDNDAVLSDVLARGPYVAGFEFLTHGDGTVPPGLFPLDVIMLHDADTPLADADLFEAAGVVAPLSTLAGAFKSAGFVNVGPDNDGVIRRIPLLMRFSGRIYPSLALATVMQAVGAGNVFLKVSSLGPESLRLGETVVPLDAAGNVLIRYRGTSKSFEYISAADLLHDRVDIKKIAGRVVFVGSSASGLKDTFAIPLDPIYPGFEVHASVADNILHGIFLKRPSWARGAEFLATLCAGVLVSLVLAWCRPWSSLLFLGLCAAGLWFGCLYLLEVKSMFLSPFYPLMVLGGVFPVVSLFKFRLAEKQAMQREREMERVRSELQVAREIQLGIVPKNFPAFPGRTEFEIFADLIPAQEVGGDYYDFFFIDEEHLCFAIGDVSDKGVPAALFMAITRTLVKNTAHSCAAPSEMMARINTVLCSDNPRAMFVTLFIGILNVRSGLVRYANGGHNPPILIGHDGHTHYLKEMSGPVVGAMPDLPYSDISLHLKAGDALFLYTDGVTEAMNEKNELFSSEQLIKDITAFQHAPVKGVIAGVLHNVKKHAGLARQSDDIAMLMIKYTGGFS